MSGAAHRDIDSVVSCVVIGVIGSQMLPVTCPAYAKAAQRVMDVFVRPRVNGIIRPSF